jgi:hypothetical protein
MLGNVRFPDRDQSPQEGLNVDDFIDLNFQTVVVRVDGFVRGRWGLFFQAFV